jgi:hypothetical protein
MHDPLYKTFRQAFPQFRVMEAARSRHAARVSRVERTVKRLAPILVLVIAACGASASPAPSSAPSPTSPPSSPGHTASPVASPTAVPSPSAIAGVIRELRADLGRAIGADDPTGPEARAVAAADAGFALRLYHQLAAGEGNLIFSPYSISTALSMTYAGAGGRTAEELAAALGIGSDATAWHSGRNDIDTWKELGVRDLFDSSAADLRGIADAGLYVGTVIHQANIDVDEHGTEAAAATAVGGDTSGGGPENEVSIAVDRPFIYLIRESGSGEILFAGRVLDPTQ